VQRNPILTASERENHHSLHFVSGGIEAALARAHEAAGDRDVRLGGGVATIRQCLNARLIDHLHFVVTPVLLGGGEPLFANMDLRLLGYEVTVKKIGAISFLLSVPSAKKHSQ
jgi:dihydrofolate reductase